jgi:putative colanic acid biosynthesis glycosyltransferase WcaI
MRILFITQYFPPETEIGGIRIQEIGARLAARGHQVAVLTGLPNYPSGELQHAYRRKAWKVTWTEKLDGLDVIRVPLYPSHSKQSFARLANYFSFALTSSLRAQVFARPDVIVSTSPPLTVGIPAWLAATRLKIPFILELRDLWPEAAIELGYLQNPLVERAAYWLESFLYRRAHCIVTVSQGMKTDLVVRGIDPTRCAVIPNGVDTSLFSPSATNDYIASLRREGLTVGVYLGTLSVYHGLDHALHLLEQLRAYPHIRVVFAAGGSARGELEAAVRQRALANVIFLPAPPRCQMPGLIASADFCLAFVKPGPFSRWLLSSKIFMYMACGRPIFAAGTGETGRVIAEAQAGMVEEPTPSGIERLTKAIGQIRENPALATLGTNGRAYAERSCSWDSLTDTYEKLLLMSARRDRNITVQEAPVPLS